MKKSFLTLTHALAFAAITFSLAVCAQAQKITYIALQAMTSQPNPPLFVQGTDGNFYSVGGTITHPNGYVFRMTPSGEITVLHYFCAQTHCSDGSIPLAPVLGSDGNLYGITIGGGNSTGSGTIYKLTLEGEFTLLYSFCSMAACADGHAAFGLTLASDGNFYGATQLGGANADGQAGTLFSISPSGEFKLLYTFCSLADCADGQQPFSAPIQGSDGNIYGTTGFGGTGTGAQGVLYKFTPAGVYSVLYNFCSRDKCNDGAQPWAISEGPNGGLFGVTASGGLQGCGTAFRLGPGTTYSVLHRFSAADGCQPFNAPTLANDGNFYNVNGVRSGGGIIYRLTPDGTFTTLHTFSCCESGGYDPAGMLLQATDGNFYGSTLLNSNGCCTGSIFRFSERLSPLVQTVPIAGPVGKQIIVLGNGLTGTTSVTFNGKSAAFTVKSDTYIQATVPAGASTGKVSVVTLGGTLDSNPQFVVTK